MVSKLLLLLCVLIQVDWPQWGGANRDFSIDISIRDVDPQDPLTLVWKQPVGSGYAGLTVHAGILVSQSRQGQRESVFARDAATGMEIWRNEYQATAFEFMIPRYGPGPHSTPCIVDDRVCTIGGTGILNVYHLKTGERIWTKDLWQTYQATKLERGYAASPIAFDGKLILPVGGRGTGVVAFDPLTGQEVWKSTDFAAAYASPSIVKHDGQPQLVCLMDQNLIALNPTTGELLWDFPYPTFKTVHVASARALRDNRFLVLSSNMATMIKMVKDQGEFQVSKLWESKALTPQVGNVIQIGNQLIGPSSGSSAAVLTGISEATGNRLWRSRLSGIGFCYLAKDGFIALSESGTLTFNQINNGTVENLATSSGLLEGRIWNTSAFSPDMIFVRDENSIQAFRLNRQE